jgi:hypothetical protein
MHVLCQMTCREELPQRPFAWEQHALTAPAHAGAADTVIEAHEHLIRADARNAATFGAVVEHLREYRKDS